ncbi:MAG: U32 family peptidase, partial [Bacillota bacterium]|nr:U32 family peptidase [Bacillota bacterium]
MAEQEAAGQLELVAPAGEWAALVAAVQNGAEAVYLGGPRFSARQYAPNFGPEELPRAVEYAHVRDCRLYVAVNTLVKEEELEEAARYLVDLYRWGVDAVILQDPGLARLARRLVPRLRLHASTQMTVHNSAGAQALEEWGFSRVVLARELSREEIAALHRSTVLELEVFVHGALCFSYSGQCLMSSLIGGRSGNRGRCAQPCRMKYRLVEEAPDRTWREREGSEEAHLLSTRDLCLVEHLPALAAAGVRALKIEGRMKRPEYVATVVRIYRAVLDRWREGKEARPTPEELRDLAQIFNRGFTTGYFLGNPGRELMSYQRPSNRGLLVGRVERYDPDRRRVQVRLEEDLAVGDGVEVWVSRGGRAAAVVRDLAVRRPGVGGAGWSGAEEARAGEIASFPLEGAVSPGDRVFRTSDASLLQKAQETWREGRERHPLPLRALVEVAEGEPLRLTLWDPEGRAAKAETEFRAQRALRHPLREEVLRQQLGRLGGTPFFLAALEVRG